MEPVTHDEILPLVREFVHETFLYMRPDASVDDDESLLRRGIMDSLGVMELVGFVEERFGVAVPEADVTEANFGAIARVAAYVARRTAGGERDAVPSARPG